ncbi:MAG: glycoside hydrolase family 57 protein [Planctomycetota bacterium]
MASVCFYFQVHQPYRLKRYSVFDDHPFYFDTEANDGICQKVADKCYRPMNRLLLELIEANDGNFRCAFSVSGTAMDQFEEYAPDVLDSFKRLAETGCVEFLAETDHHSLSFLYSRREFEEQVRLHTAKVERHFGQTPTVFRNTELVYSNDVGHAVSQLAGPDGKPRFKGMCCEGWDDYLGFRKPSYVYAPPGGPTGADGKPFGLLLKNYRLSDDIAFRFGNRGWAEWPLDAGKFATWVNDVNGDGYLVNLFMDYETFGEHQWADTGIFDFMRALPAAIFDVAPGENHFVTPSEAFEQFEPVGEYDVPNYLSWADTERDLSAWLGNAMQANALHETYKAEAELRTAVRLADEVADTQPELAKQVSYVVEDWRKLTTSDHFYYMCTKYWADGDVHKYFSPYDSPYDGYINFMNVLDNLRARITRLDMKPEIVKR